MLSTPTTSVGGPRVRFVVHGTPIPQGSKGCSCRGGISRLFDSNAAALRPWRKAVTEAAREAHEGRPPLRGPLVLSGEFRFPMPSARSGWQRDLGRIWHDHKPDLDKLVRAVGDALTDAEVIADDARIAMFERLYKCEVHRLWTGADLTVEQLEALT